VASRAGVRPITADEVAAIIDAGGRTVYRFDVRPREQHVAGHPDGFAWAPGGQLVQETDVHAPVRGALVVLYDDAGVRADMTASWLAQMGWDVRVLTGPAALTAGADRPSRRGVPAVEEVAPTVLSATPDAVVVDVSTSTSYRRGHVRGAAWATRRDVVDGAGPDEMVLVSEDSAVAAFTAAEVVARDPQRRARVVAGGTAAWAAAGLPLESGGERWWSQPADVYVRPYVGTDVDPAVMQAYLDWEHGLVAQLERDGTHGFWVLGARR
jgi:rhodanese-related sulfurtransferase